MVYDSTRPSPLIYYYKICETDEVNWFLNKFLRRQRMGEEAYTWVWDDFLGMSRIG